jgi:hypothetical protein
MEYERTPKPTESALLLASMTARDQRRALRLARLSIGPDITKRGRRREENPAFLANKPPKVHEPAVMYLGDKLKGLAEPLVEQFTRSYRIPRKPAVHVAYKQAGKRRNSQRSVETARQEGDLLRHERQEEHIADNIQRGTREKYNIAMLRRSALLHIHEAIQTGAPFDPAAAQYAGNALVSFAEGLRPLPAPWKNYPYQDDIDTNIEWIGTYAQTDPEILRDNPAVILVVGQEQRREADYWKERYDLAVEVDGQERITDVDREAQAYVRQQIIDFGFDEARVPVIL